MANPAVAFLTLVLFILKELAHIPPRVGEPERGYYLVVVTGALVAWFYGSLLYRLKKEEEKDKKELEKFLALETLYQRVISSN